MQFERLDVKHSRIQPIATILAGLLLVPLGIWNLFDFVKYGFKPVPFLMGSAMILGFAMVFWLYALGFLRSVKFFSAGVVERNDGKRFPISDLMRVADKMHTSPRTNRRLLWRTELHFKDGSTAWILPLKVSNFSEIKAYVDNLPCEHIET